MKTKLFSVLLVPLLSGLPVPVAVAQSGLRSLPECKEEQVVIEISWSHGVPIDWVTNYWGSSERPIPGSVMNDGFYPRLSEATPCVHLGYAYRYGRPALPGEYWWQTESRILRHYMPGDENNTNSPYYHRDTE